MTIFDTFLKKTIILIITCILFSYSGYLFPDYNKAIFCIILALTVLVTYKSFETGIYIAITELLIGSQGYLFYYDLGTFKISIRIGIFLILCLFFLYNVYKTRKIKFFEYSLKKYYIFFGILILWGIIAALIYKQPLKNIFLDVNAYFYFFYIVIFLQGITTKKHLQKILQISIASLITLTLHSLALLYIFSHTIVPWMRPLYKWTRDNRIGEIVRPFIESNFHRIFFQHQIYAILGFIILTTLFFLYKEIRQNKKAYIGILVLDATCLSVTLLSFSRSFWVGMLLSGIIILGFIIAKYKKHFKNYLRIFIESIGIIILALLLIFISINFPYPSQGYISSGDVFKNRLNFTDEAAISSRWSLLPVLTNEASNHLILGQGFGKEITYQAKDPRILTEKNPQGWYTTYAFEWGYLDIILKIGLLGLGVYLYLLRKIFDQGWHVYKKLAQGYEKYTILGLLIAFIGLLIIHVFTPYINHPLGIGYIVLISVIFDVYKKNLEFRI